MWAWPQAIRPRVWEYMPAVLTGAEVSTNACRSLFYTIENVHVLNYILCHYVVSNEGLKNVLPHLYRHTNSLRTCATTSAGVGVAPCVKIVAVCVINPRRACAARVTVVGSVCPSVCLCVRYFRSAFTNEQSCYKQTCILSGI